jgi:hypothetical protein
LHDPGQVTRVDHLGLPRQMEPPNSADDFIPAALAAYGVEADEIELAVMGAAHDLFWPAILELLALDTGGVAPEPASDLSRAPRSR